MEPSRRDFLKVSGGGAGGTALGGLAGLGANLAPTLARAQELRIKDAPSPPTRSPRPSRPGCSLLEQCLAAADTVSTGATRAMALEVFAEWRLVAVAPAFGDWLARGAPSADAG
jgi:TAT (twin-arginine translocation) pathway signal sequence